MEFILIYCFMLSFCSSPHCTRLLHFLWDKFEAAFWICGQRYLYVLSSRCNYAFVSKRCTEIVLSLGRSFILESLSFLWMFSIHPHTQQTPPHTLYFGWSQTISTTNIRNTEEAVWGPQYSPRLLYWPRPVGPQSVWWPRGVLWPEYGLWGVSYFYYPTIFISMQLWQYFHILTRGKFCNRNTPNPQYFPLLTSSG